MSIKISAIICTFNRDNYLRKAIQSLVKQTLDNDFHEIIIVDNRSTDSTKKIVTKEFAHVSNLRYLYEPTQGLSQARNTGWQNARGDYVAYLDDDAIASPQWLEKILEVFETVKPQPGAVGGKIEPIWEAPRPIWLSDRLAGGLTILNWSDTPIVIEENQWLAGANIAYPKHILEAVNGFEVNLGRKGHNLLSCEESLLNNLIKRKGYSIYYDPQIAIKHHIPASRLIKSWHIKRQYWNGVSVSMAMRYQTRPSLLMRLKKVRKLIKNEILPLTKEILINQQINQDKLFDLQCILFSKFGYIYGLLALANRC